MSEFSIPQPETPKRGRPQAVSDIALQTRFLKILEFFEYYWAHVAWDLIRAKTLPQLRDALRRARKDSLSELDLFLFEPTSRTDRAELQALDKQERKISALTRTAFEQERVAREKLETATHAVNADPANEQLQLFKHRKEQQYSSAHNQLSALREEGERLDAKKKQKQAFYSQSELLDFIHSGRYSLTPVNYAKAMAGLPWVSWRQSAERLQDFEVHHPYGIEYEKFRIVEKALRTRPRTCANGVDQVKASLLREKSGGYAVKKLKSEWYFLKVSIEAVYQQKTELPAIPYRVFAEYQSRTRAKSSADLLWEEEEGLP